MDFSLKNKNVKEHIKQIAKMSQSVFIHSPVLVMADKFLKCLFHIPLKSPPASPLVHMQVSFLFLWEPLRLDVVAIKSYSQKS